MRRAESRSGASTRPPARTIRVTGRGAAPTAKAWEHGGGSIWVPGAYDPDLNLVYWGTGNAGPDYNGAEREGDNLYTASIVALDADSGKLRWHYQFTPHDIWDYGLDADAGAADLTLDGEPRKVVLFANRNGFFYVSTARPATDQGQTVHRDDVGERDSARRPADAPAQQRAERGRDESLSRSVRRDELDAAVARSGARSLLRDGTRIVRNVLLLEGRLQPRRRVSRRRGAAPRRSSV
jgi:glucose dehydrogenase